jgi:hypothetical protein
LAHAIKQTQALGGDTDFDAGLVEAHEIHAARAYLVFNSKTDTRTV